MNTTIDKLLDVDKEARRTLDEARQYYERTMSDIEEEKHRLLEDYKARGIEHIRELEEEQAGEVEEVAALTRDRTAKLLAAMEACYSERHDSWEDEIFSRCTRSTNS